MDPPWSVRIEDRAPLSLVSVVRGHAWVIPDDDAPVRLGAGSVAVMRGPDPYGFADDPATRAQVVIHPGQHCTTPDGQDLAQAMDLGVRSWGNSPAGSTSMLIGTYERNSEIGRQLLSVLPRLVVMPAGAWDSPLLEMLGQEIVKEEPGQEAVLDRLLDLLLVAVLRAWFSSHQAEAPGWYRAQGDPVVGRALRVLQNNPAQPWTVATLARETGVSRAALRTWYRTGQIPSRLVDGPHGPQRLVPLALVAARAEASPRLRHSAERRLADEAQIELLRHRVDQFELRPAALERRLPSETVPPEA